MVKANFMLIAAVLVTVALIGGFITVGAFVSQGQIQSISKTTLDGKPAILISMLAGSGALGQSALTAEISKSVDPDWDTSKSASIQITKLKDTYTYTLTERNGATKNVYKYYINSSCFGQVDCVSKYPGKDFSMFRAACTAPNQANIAIDTGGALNPRWRCYTATPTWVVGDFNSVGGSYSPQVSVSMLKYNTGDRPWEGVGSYEDVAEVILDNQVRSGSLIGESGVVYGKATITSLSALFNEPPPSTSIKAIRSSSGTPSYSLVDQSYDAEIARIYTQLGTCLANNKAGAAGAQTYNIFNIGFGLFESYQETAANCFSTVNGGIDQSPSIASLRGDFLNLKTNGLLDTTKLNSDNKLVIDNNFAVPAVTMVIYADSVGIVTTAAGAPSFVSCTPLSNIPAGTSGTFTMSILGTPSSALQWRADCTSPITATTKSGLVSLDAIGGATVQVPFTSGSVSGTSTCTVSALATDLDPAKTKTSVCSINQNGVCPNVPKTGCYLKPDCSEVCPVIPPPCNTTPATGCYMNDQCVQVCGNQTTTCLPIVQKATTQQVGATSFFGFTFGGTTVQSCVWDFPVLAAVLLVAAGILLAMKKEKYAKVVGITGLALLVLSFVADNALLLALGGTGILFIAVVAAAAYIVIRLKLI
jgi:hypothetical protein